jgi:hypothetical protein
MGRGSNQGARIGVLRRGKDIARISFLNNLAKIHDSDPVTHPANNRKIMRYEDIGKPKSVAQIIE